MNGPIAQLVALTCHGNAALQGRDIPRFFPDNSTCQFQEYAKFRDCRNGERDVAATPDLWFRELRATGVLGLMLKRAPADDEPVPDRLLAGFVGGGGTWYADAVMPDGTSQSWVANWEVGDRNAPDRRIWRVSYDLSDRRRSPGSLPRSLSTITADFKAALTSIHAFSAKHAGEGGFTTCFARALEALENPALVPGYHKDLYPPDTISKTAQSVLGAAWPAWVFGGMGSWNDVGFENAPEYEQVSEALFQTMTEAIAVAASSSWKGSGIED